MANIIYAKFNSGSEVRNVLDPDMWVGGVVPGPNDVARFWYAGINASYENSYFDQNTYYGQRDGLARVGIPFTTNQLTGLQNNEFTASKFIPSLVDMKSSGNYGNTSFFSLNTEQGTSYKPYYEKSLAVRGYFGPAYYKEYAKYFRFSNSNAVSITINGVTYSESDTTTYNTKQKMCARMIELLDGNIPSKYRIIGPHNGTGISNTVAQRETTYSGSYFTITFSSGSDVAPTNTHTVASQWYSVSNITVGDNSNHYRMMKSMITSSNPFIVMEGAAPSGSAGNYRFAYNYDWTSGSGYWWQPGPRQANGYQRGIGPGNVDWIKIDFQDFASTSFPISCSIDTNYIVPTVRPYNDYPSDEIYLDTRYMPDTYKSQSVGYFRNYNDNIWTEYSIQKYELTGSQHWNVGMIEMGDYNHFHVKDNAKITLHDLQDGTYYPAIDFVNMGAYLTTLLVTDSATLQVSSSRSSLPAEAGIWARTSNISLILSGSQNYSSSIAPSSSTANDATIQISNLSGSFGIGDYVTIESSGSYRHWNPLFKNHTLEGDLFLTGSKPSMSYADVITQGAYYGTYQAIREQPYLTSGSLDVQASFGLVDEWTHPIENDEIIQIASMSGDFATVAKRYPKEGKVQDDLGLYNRNSFITTFPSASIPSNYDGTKRVVLVDSTHKSFEPDEVLVIDDTPYSVLHATSHLSQSKFFNFSDGSARADQVFKSAQGQHSGSSIFTQAFGERGITTSVYWAETYQKHTLLITGSEEGFKGGGWGLEQGTGMQAEALGSYQYNAGQYGGRSGSSNGYTALRLDPTLAYTWRNNTHKIQSTSYIHGTYLIDNLLFEDGEITVSGSLIRDGHGDPTSSVAWDPENGFGLLWEQPINQSGAEMQHTYQSNPRTGYVYPWPYCKAVGIWGYYGDPGIYTGTSNYTLGVPLGQSGSAGYRSAGNGTVAPYIYGKYTDPDFTSSLGLDIDHIRLPANTGSCHIRVDIQDELADTYLGIKGQEKLIATTPGGRGKGGVGIWLKKYASIHSINIKKRYQMLILDTTNSFTKGNKIIEGGLLESHIPNKKVKFIGTEIVDVKGFKNLAKDAIRNEGSSSIKPYVHSICRSGTKATVGYGETRYYTNMPFAAKMCEPQTFGQGQANTNYYAIVDLGTPTEFDTIGMIYAQPSYGTEYYANNKMNNVSFEVTDDIGVESPTWTTVRATENDIRQWNGRQGIRYYTFASGSVTARYIKHKCSGGTRYSTMGYNLTHFGIYNISASCVPGTAPVAGHTKDFYGGPTSSICQIELANIKNWNVGDELYLCHKSDTTFHGFSNYITYPNVSLLTNYQSLTGSAEGEIHGGPTDVFTIQAINGNVITLDRAPIYKLEDGMIAYKFNRGGITLEGMNNTSIFHVNTSTSSPWTHIQNVTAKNAYFYTPGDADYQNYFYFDNVSISSKYMNYYQYMGVGPGTFMRNVLIVGNWYGYGQLYPNSGQHMSALYFNVVAHYTGDMNNYQSTMLKNWVSNFEHNNAMFLGYQSQYANYTGKKGNLADKIILKNSFVNMRYPNEYLRRSIYTMSYGGNTSVFDRAQVSNIIFSPDTSAEFISHYGYMGMQGKNLANKYLETKGKTLGVNLDTRRNNINGAWNRYNYDTSGFRTAFNSYHTNTLFEGTFVSGKASTAFQGNDYVVLGHYYYKTFFVKKDDEFQLYQLGYNYKSSTYDLCSLYCDFEVLEDTDVRFDFDCEYKLTFAGKYGVGSGETNSNYSLKQAQQVVLLNGNREVLDNIDFTADDFTTIQHRKTHSLRAGVYRIETRFHNQYNQDNMFHKMSFKSMDLKLVTSDLTKVKVYDSNFDVLSLFDKARFEQRRDTSKTLTATSNGGKDLVLKQANDLGGTTNYKFNKIKL